ncbi:protein of unknown function (plasmid) [Caballeronia sp. S22]
MSHREIKQACGQDRTDPEVTFARNHGASVFVSFNYSSSEGSEQRACHVMAEVRVTASKVLVLSMAAALSPRCR